MNRVTYNTVYIQYGVELHTQNTRSARCVGSSNVCIYNNTFLILRTQKMKKQNRAENYTYLFIYLFICKYSSLS